MRDRKVSVMRVSRRNVIARRHGQRRRGVSLDSVMLGLVIVLLMTPALLGMIKRSYDIQQDQTTGAEMETMAEAARGYVTERYDEIRRGFVERANDAAVAVDSPLTMILTPEDLAMDGYLSRAFVTTTGDPQNYRGQSYRLMIRGVMRGDTAFPQTTLTKNDIVTIGGPVTDGTNLLNDNVVDGDTSNDEMDIESVLVTVGGDPFTPIRAARVAAATKSPVVTDIREEGGDLVAVGNQGNFQIPLDAWRDIAADSGEEIEAGRVLSVVSLSGYAGFGSGGGEEVDYRRTLLRCYGLTEGSPDYESCLEDGNDMWTSIVFNDLPDGSRPGIFNVGQITCEGDGGAAITGAADTLSINCGTVAIGGDVTADNATLAGDLSLTGSDSTIDMDGANASIVVSGDNGRIDVSGDNGRIELQGNNVAEHLVLASGIVAVGDTIPLPDPAVTDMCPTNAVQPQFSVTGAIESAGRAVSGYRPYVGGDRVARIIFFTSEDFCDTGRGTPGSLLTPMSTAGWDSDDFESGSFLQTVTNADGSITQSYPNAAYRGAPSACLNKPADLVLGSQADGYPDAYWVGNGQGLIKYDYMCVPE